MSDIEFKSIEVKAASDKKKLLRLNHSNWMYTISSQNVWKDDTPENKEKSQKMYNDLQAAVNEFCKKENIVKYLELHEDAQAEGHSLTADYITGINVLSSIEIGAKRGLIHSHIGVQISHRTKIQMNYKEITKFFKSYNKSWTSKANFMRGADLSAMMQNYITKDYHSK